MKKILFFFILAGIFLCSCVSGPGKSDKEKADTPKVKTFKTVQTLDSIKKGDTVMIVLNGKKYQVTSVESEPEDESPAPGGKNMLKATKTNKPCDSESFDGSDRKAAKLSIAPGTATAYNTLADFILSLPSDAVMGALHISTGPTSNRVTKEKHNVHILKAFIYTYTHEGDEDYHVILGTTDQPNSAKFFNMEVSGLPASNSSAYAKLKSTRDAFTGFFNIKGCVSGYVPVFNPPVEVEVTGSIFFDALHYTDHTTIGPNGYHPSSYWEIHPATEIIFM